MKKIAVLSIMVHDRNSVSRVNQLLHEACDDILGRMGVPIKSHDLSIISIIIETSDDVFNHLIESLQELPGVRVKYIQE